MCSPTLIGIGMAALTGVQLVQQNRAVAKQAEASAEAANLNSNFQQAALRQRAIEQSASASEQATASEIQAARTASAARVSSGEAGIAGTGVNRILGNVGQQQARSLAIQTRNLQGQLGQIRTQQDITQRNLETTLSNIESQAEAQTTGPLEAVAKIGSSYFGGVQTGNAMGLGQAGAGISLFGEGGLISDPSNFMTPAAKTSLANAEKTGFSDEFLYGDFLQRQLQRLQ